MQFKTRRPSAGTVIGTVALVFAITGAAVALPGSNTVTSGDIKNNNVKTADIKNGHVKTNDLNKNAVAPKVRTQADLIGNSQNLGTNSTVTAATKTVPAGRYAIWGKVVLFVNGNDSFSCALMLGNTELDEARFNPEEDIAQTVTLPVMSVASVPTGTPIDLECSSASESGSVDESKIIAIPTA